MRRKGNILFRSIFIFALIITFLFIALVDIPMLIDTTDVRMDTNSSISDTNLNQGDTVTLNHTTRPVRSDRVLVVGTSVEPGSADAGNVSYAGHNLTRRVSASNGVAASLWTLKDPPTGTNELNVTDFQGSPDVVVVGAATYAGVDFDSPFYGFSNNTGVGDFAFIEVSPERAGDVLVDDLATTGADGSPSFISDGTVLWNIVETVGGVDSVGAGSFKESRGNETTRSWELNQDTTQWAHVGLVIDAKLQNPELAELENLLDDFKDVVFPLLLLFIFVAALVGLVTGD